MSQKQQTTQSKITQKQQSEITITDTQNPEMSSNTTHNHSKPPVIVYQASHMFKAYKSIRANIRRTIIQRSSRLSDLYQSNVFFKREDGQITRTYKVRGAINKISNLTTEQKKQGVYCCSAGNQGVALAYACQVLKIKGTIFVPQTTPKDKISRIQEFGKEYIQIKTVGLSLQECDQIATKYGEENNLISVKLDEKEVIEGCGSVGIEILEDFPFKGKIDYVLFPVSSGTLGAGISSYFYQLSPETKIIGVKHIHSENEMVYEDMQKNMQLDATQTFQIMDNLPNYEELEIPEGEAYDQVLQLYNDEGIILEPHGALAPAALKVLSEKFGSLKGKNIVCVLTGKNTSISRMNDIKILANVYQKKNLYLLVDFFRKPDAIKEFMVKCLSLDDEVLQIEYTKKSNREKGPALVGIEFGNSDNYEKLLNNMNKFNITYKIIQPTDEIFQLKV